MMIVVSFESEQEYNDFHAPAKTYDKPTLQNAVATMAVAGLKKIPIIKIIRSLTKWGLKDAKEFVEDAHEPFRMKTGW